MAKQEQDRPQDLGVEDRMKQYQEALEDFRTPTYFREEVLRNVYHSLIEECRAQVAETD